MEFDSFASRNRMNAKSFGLDIEEKTGRLHHDTVDTETEDRGGFWRHMRRSKQVFFFLVG